MIRSRLVMLTTCLAVTVIFAGCASNRPKPTATPEEQDLALEGMDISLAPISEGLIFSEPSPEDRLILKDIHFDFDKSDIKPGEENILNDISTWFLNHPQAQLQIEGHCDERGTKEYNLALGERRALSVRSALTARGINPRLLHTISYGEEKPLCGDSSEECWAQNRRAHFLVEYGESSGRAEAPPAPDKIQVEIEESLVMEESVPVPEEESGPEESSTWSRPIKRFDD